MNIVILAGQLSSDPRRTELASGTVLWHLEVSCPDGEGRLVGVPVTWEGDVPAAWVSGTAIVVAGSVRRRFFRSAGSTHSRTEVVALSVVEVTRRRSEHAALTRACRSLGSESVAGLRSILGTPSAA